MQSPSSPESNKPGSIPGNPIQKMNWQPIETAPKNERIILCLDGRDWSIGSWDKHAFDGPAWVDDSLDPVPFLLLPTHWMPLPLLPGRNKFGNITCSQCGRDFGAGDHGYSHCEDHGGEISTADLINACVDGFSAQPCYMCGNKPWLKTEGKLSSEMHYECPVCGRGGRWGGSSLSEREAARMWNESNNNKA
jgi:hypothetical protein